MKRAAAVLLAICMVLSPVLMISDGTEGAGPFPLQGYVLTDSGLGLADATVVAENVTSGLTYSALTDSEGQYALQVPIEGTYNITVSLMNYSAVTTHNDVAVPGPVGTMINFTMEEVLGMVRGFVTDGSVSVKGAIVHLTNQAFNYTATSSAPLGEYEMVGVQPGVYVAYAEKLGYDRGNYPAPVVIQRGSIAEINITLTEQPATLFGKVLNQNNNPLKGVRVSIGSPDFDTIVISDENGNYSFVGLTAGDYKVKYELDGYNTEVVNIALDPYEERRLDIVMERDTTNQTAVLFGFDLPHSIMLVALMVGIVMVALGVIMTTRAHKRPDRLARVEIEEEEKPKE
jgi:hypothetical protein